jgi:Glycosyltransferase family 87
MVGNVYGVRLLRDPGIQKAGVAVLATVLVLARLIQLLYVPVARIGYDFVYYWVAARNLLDGRPIYSAQQLAGPYAPQGQEGFLYPPPLAALVTPFAQLFTDLIPAALAWSFLGAVVAVIAIVRVAWLERLSERFPILAGRGVVLVLIAAFALPEFVDELINGNVHLFLLGLFVLAWIGVRRGDVAGQRIAGLAIGVATVIKVFPVVAVLWFVLTGRLRAAWWSAIGAVALSLATLPITGIQPWLDYPTVLANLSAPSDVAASFAPTVWLAPILGFGVARVLVTVVGLAVIAWSARRLDARTGFAVTVLVSVLITPALWSHYLSLIVLPLLLALSGGVSLVILGLDYVLLSAGSQTALGDLDWITARAMPTLGALLLLGALLMRPKASAVQAVQA